MLPQILVTGYGPFRDILHNPSDLVAKDVVARIGAADSRLARVYSCAHHRSVAVSRDGLDAFYSEWSELPTHIVHVGVSAAATKVCFETIAFNVTAEGGLAASLAAQRRATQPSTPPPAPPTPSTPKVAADDRQADAQGTAKDRIDDSPDALDLLPTTFDVHSPRFHRYLKAHADVAQWSRDAGWYFCNEIFYRSLLK
ncbi:hypothetical protein BC830DRAFT_1156886, partial [Chytriomyces sp. MP71]